MSDNISPFWSFTPATEEEEHTEESEADNDRQPRITALDRSEENE